jgi:3-phosphoshikimate 1-carboxyvinyltransferase
MGFSMYSLRGNTTVPGDKSISHRALILLSQASGTGAIHNLSTGEDIKTTAKALRKLGVTINSMANDKVMVEGRNWELSNNSSPLALNMGNSGTTARLLMGLLAATDITVNFIGDESLSRRPMARVTTPLSLMGAKFKMNEGGRLPLSLLGNPSLKTIRYKLPIASAQVKSAIILAALNTQGITKIIDPFGTRDHTEIMLKFLGAGIIVDGDEITINGKKGLIARDITIPGDASSAAFICAAALLIPGSKIKLQNIGMNDSRTGFYKIARKMGAKIEYTNIRTTCGEKVADIEVEYSKLLATYIDSNLIPTMIDELPILAILASCSNGITAIKGIKELRHKESDRIQSMVEGLTNCGVSVEFGDDWIAIKGNGKPPTGGCTINSHKDHRIAMAFHTLGLVSERPIYIDDNNVFNISFPSFIEKLEQLKV